MKAQIQSSPKKVIQPTASPTLEQSFTTSAPSCYGAQGASASDSCPREFFRLPRAGCRDPLTGLSRSMLNLLVLPCKENGFRPPIKSISLRRKGTLRGARLVSTSSTLEFLRRLEAEQSQAETAQQEGEQANLGNDFSI
ncbi:MAG: hypothetical protein WCS31_07025 [Verrucomicrobiae bacterium]